MDVKATALGGLKSAFRVFLQDLEALPEDAFNKSLGGKARTIADIVYEVNLLNDHIRLTVRGEPLFDWPEGWILAPEQARTKEAALRSFQSSSERILATIEDMTDEDLEAPLQTDNGETTRLERCRFMTLHVWYHSGQLNYIQTLLGDVNGGVKFLKSARQFSPLRRPCSRWSRLR